MRLALVAVALFSCELVVARNLWTGRNKPMGHDSAVAGKYGDRIGGFCYNATHTCEGDTCYNGPSDDNNTDVCKGDMTHVTNHPDWNCEWKAKPYYCHDYYSEKEIKLKINQELAIFGLILWALMIVAFFLPLLIPDQWFDKDVKVRVRMDGKPIGVNDWRNKKKEFIGMTRKWHYITTVACFVIGLVSLFLSVISIAFFFVAIIFWLAAIMGCCGCCCMLKKDKEDDGVTCSDTGDASYWTYYCMAVGGGLLACLFSVIWALFYIVTFKHSAYSVVEYSALAAAIVGVVGCMGCCYQRFLVKKKNDYNPKTEQAVDRRVRLDRLQVAVSLKKRLDATTDFSKWIVGFVAFLIVSQAIKDQRHFRAFRDYNFYYNAGFIFLLFTFVLFLFCGAVSSGLSQQIELGHVSKYCPFFTWFLQVLNLFGVICFLHATTLFQETFHWGAPYKSLPRNLTIAFVASYGLLWLFFTLSTVDLYEEFEILGNSRDFGYFDGDDWVSSWGTNFLNSLFPYRDKELYEHFNCKPLSNDAVGSLAKPSYTIGAGKTQPAIDRTKGHVEIVALLRERFKKDFPLHAAAKAGNVDEIKRLLNEGEDVNGVANGLTALLIACENGQLEAAETLLDHGANMGCLMGIVSAPADSRHSPMDDEPASPHP